MIDLNICAKCLNCEAFSPSKVDENGKLMELPAVDCALSEITLLGDSELPENCPYILEQQLREPEAYDDFQSMMEEGRRKTKEEREEKPEEKLDDNTVELQSEKA